MPQFKHSGRRRPAHPPTHPIVPLSPDFTRSHSTEILAIHNDIPYVHWKEQDLLADASPVGIPYSDKWNLSYAAMDGERVIGFLLSYRRKISEQHPFNSIYLHRGGIAAEYRQNGLWKQVVRTALGYYAQNYPDVTTYTLQTNDEPRNLPVINLYESLGFEHHMHVFYPDKVDTLMTLSRTALLASVAD